MQSYDSRWLKLFLFCLGISIGTAFIMQWLAGDFWLKEERFSIFGLELFYSKQQVINVLTQLQEPALRASKIALNYQLVFDFAFMAGIYPAIASACMLAKARSGSVGVRNFLFALAILQPLAWAFDVTENYYLLSWMQKPEIGEEFGVYHNLVAAKWIIAIVGGLAAFITWGFSKRKKSSI
jgi:hypothetical protein